MSSISFCPKAWLFKRLSIGYPEEDLNYQIAKNTFLKNKLYGLKEFFELSIALNMLVFFKYSPVHWNMLAIEYLLLSKIIPMEDKIIHTYQTKPQISQF